MILKSSKPSSESKRAAWKLRIVAGLSPPIANVAGGFCPPRVEPDEIAHIAFPRAYRRIAHRPGTDFFAWLSRSPATSSARSEKIQRLALQQRNTWKKSCRATGQRRRDFGTGGSSPRFLAECLDLLSAGAQPRLALRRRSAREAIAQHLGRSASAVSVQLFGLRKILRDCIDRKMATPTNTAIPSDAT